MAVVRAIGEKKAAATARRRGGSREGTRGRFTLLLFGMLAAGLASGGATEAERRAERTLSAVGCVPGLNENSGTYAAIGVSRVAIPDAANADECERLRTKCLKSALLEAKGRLALLVAGRDETLRDFSASGGRERLRLVYKTMADVRFAGCRELPVAESWSQTGRVYTVAVPVVYRTAWGRTAQDAVQGWSAADRAFLSARIDRLPDAQRIGCFKCRNRSGADYIVAFGQADAEQKQGKELQRAIKCAEVSALGAMAFWLNSTVSVRTLAEEYEESGDGECAAWSDFCEKVSATCQYKGLPVNEVTSGWTRSPVTGRRLYWCAYGARLKQKATRRN